MTCMMNYEIAAHLPGARNDNHPRVVARLKKSAPFFIAKRRVATKQSLVGQ